MGVWSRKSVEALRAEAGGEHGGHSLTRSLGVVSLTAFGVGNTVGAGIFVLTGSVAATHAGPAVTLCFIIASIACFFAGLCYAEFAGMAPVAGSAYSYAYASFGEGVAWIIGWCIMLEYLFSASVVAIGWSGYVNSSLHDLGVDIPAVLSSAPVKVNDAGHLVATGSWFDLPAMLSIFGCTALLLVGIRESGIVNAIIVTTKVIAILIIVAFAAHVVSPAHWHPFVPENAGRFGDFGWSGVAMGAGIVFFSYIGFDGISTLAEEAKNPQRTIPLSLFASLVICTTLYVAVSLMITGLTDYHDLNVPDPLYFALSKVDANLAWLKFLVAFVAVVGLMSVILLSLLGQTRIFYAMGRDGLLPAALSRTGKRFKTPYLGTWITGILAALTAGFTPLGLLGELISIGTLLAFAMVCAGILVLRKIAPDAHRAFRTPWVPLIPVLGVITCVALMFSLPNDTWIRLVIWLVVGIAFYAMYGRKYSKLNASGRS